MSSNRHHQPVESSDPAHGSFEISRKAEDVVCSPSPVLLNGVKPGSESSLTIIPVPHGTAELLQQFTGGFISFVPSFDFTPESAEKSITIDFGRQEKAVGIQGKNQGKTETERY